MEEEYKTPKKGSLKYLKLVLMLGKAKKKVFIFFAVLSVFLTGLNLLAQNMPRFILDIAMPNKDFQLFFLYAISFFILIVLFMIGKFSQRLNVEKASIEIVSDLKVRMFSHLTRAKLDFFHRNPVGRLLTRIESDVEGLRLVFQFLMVTVFGDAIQSIAAFAFMFIVDFRVAGWLMIPVIIIIIGSVLYQKFARPRIVELRKKIAKITGYIAESITGIRTIQAFKNEKDFERRFEEQVEHRRMEQIKIFMMLLLYFRGAFTMQRLGSWIIVFTFGLLTQSTTDVSIGTLVMFTTLVTIAITPLRIISEQFGQIQQAFASLERIDNIMNLEREDNKKLYTLVKEDQDLVQKDIDIQRAIAKTKTIEKGIEFRNVWFSYDYYSKADEDLSESEVEWVLKGISFSLPTGKSLALIGPTGCGKTTIIKLLFRFYEPQKGTILLDGKDIKEYSLHELRSYIGLVQQENHLFPGTIKDNITLDNKNIVEDRISDYAARVGSNLFIEKREGNYGAEVKERGINFSSGEKQLIAFTRCMVYDRPVLILDEATSNIDAHSEKLIQRTIINMLESNKTSIMIAHRLSTIRHASQILVMEDGKILERGNHEELLEKEGKYKQYFKYQLSENVGEVSS